MNYTEKYHLPQWEETDRIMRADFNQMCADIEEGMSENREAGEELAQRITAAEAGAVGAAQAGLFRLAYNHWHYLDALASKPRQMGFFQQSFGKNQTAVEGMLQLDGCCWMANGDGVLSPDDIRPSFQIGQSINSAQNRNTATGTFTAPYGGWIKFVYLTGSTRSDSAVNIGYTVTLSGGGTTVSTTGTLYLAGGNGSGSEAFPTNLPVHAGTSYTISVQLHSFPKSIELRFYPQGDFFLVTEGHKSAAASVSRKLQVGEASQGGMILVHHRTYGAGGTLTLDWDGETLSPVLTRSISFHGQSVREAEFRLTRAVPATSTVTLNLQCAPGGEISLYGWGGLLI